MRAGAGERVRGRPGARVDVEMNIRAIAVGVVFGAFQFDLSGKKSILLLVSNADGELRFVALSVQ